MKFEGWQDIKRILLCLLAGVGMTITLKLFVYPGGLLPGGVTGLAVLLQTVFLKVWGVHIPFGPLNILLNVFPFILSYKKIGKKFTLFSAIPVATLSILTDVMPNITFTEDILLISVFGGIVSGITALPCLLARASSGGTDIISIYISERKQIDAWNYILAFNAVLLIIDGYLLGWDKALYSIIFQYATTQVVNLLYKRYKKNTLFIVTDSPKAITKVINTETDHSASEMRVMGCYKGQPKTMVYSVISSDELNRVLKKLKEADPDAFINVLKTDYLTGRFNIKPND